MDTDAVALVMAGGRSSRMRASGSPVHKALMPVAGRSLLEWNLATLVRWGFRRIAVAVNASEAEVLEAVDAAGRRYAREGAAEIAILREDRPLGTIGAAKLVGTRRGDVLVVNVDNLTALDLNRLVAWHRDRRSAMTIATHVHPFQIPFGELIVRGGVVHAYREKPVRPVRVSSGTYVLSNAACEAIPPGQAVDVPDLFVRLTAAGARVTAFAHDAPWVDVNTAADLARAEELVRTCANAFSPDRAHSVAH